MRKRWTAADVDRIERRAGEQGLAVKWRYRYYIGVDCGVQTGLAIWDSADKKFYLLESVKIHTALQHVSEWHKAFARSGVMVRIEDARQRKMIPWEKDEKAERGRREGAGSVKRDAKIWDDFLADLGIDYEMIAPKDNVTKVTQDFFRMATGHQAVTNEHERDAGMLVYSL
jgi:hypothetical protein